ncbi:hypothetical protein llh_13865 (plasmid) [Lactococcus cremoris subsp. cremoris A76]|nr:hypothetical protein llh_13865 [Lactococcus cremoris subsp. cremoris A76]
MVPFNKVIRFGFKKIENIGVPFFNFILGFILSVLFLTVGMLLLDTIEKINKHFVLRHVFLKI